MTECSYDVIHCDVCGGVYDAPHQPPKPTPDSEVGRALRELAEVVPHGFFVSYDKLFVNVPPAWKIRVPFGGPEITGLTLSAVADTVREALE